jgi:hypothetical protein
MNATTFSDGSILRSLGLALQRDENTARPVGTEASPVLFRVCGWCKIGIGTAPALPPNLPGDVSHGICASCKVGFLERLAAERQPLRRAA